MNIAQTNLGGSPLETHEKEMEEGLVWLVVQVAELFTKAFKYKINLNVPWTEC